ncbi:hypothetical protein LCGC14_2576900, partial [marine sediment metagenome]
GKTSEQLDIAEELAGSLSKPSTNRFAVTTAGGGASAPETPIERANRIIEAHQSEGHWRSGPKGGSSDGVKVTSDKD